MSYTSDSEIINLSFAEPAQAADIIESGAITMEQILAACAIFNPVHPNLTTSARFMKVIAGAGDDQPSTRREVLIAYSSGFLFKGIRAILGQPKSTTMIDLIGYLVSHADQSEGDLFKTKALALLSAANTNSPITLDNSIEDNKICSKFLFWCIYVLAWIAHTDDEANSFAINGVVFDRNFNLILPSSDQIKDDRISKLETEAAITRSQLADMNSLLLKIYDSLPGTTTKAASNILDTSIPKSRSRAPIKPTRPPSSTATSNANPPNSGSHNDSLLTNDYSSGDEDEEDNESNISESSSTLLDIKDSRLDFSRGRSDSPIKATKAHRSFSTADNNFRQNNLTNWTQEHLLQPHSIEALANMLANEGLLTSTAAGTQYRNTIIGSTRGGVKFPILSQPLGNKVVNLQPLLAYPVSMYQLKIHMEQNKQISVEVAKPTYDDIRHRDWPYSFANKYSEFTTRLSQRWDDIVSSSLSSKKHLSIYAVFLQCYIHFMKIVINDRNPELFDKFDEVWSRVYQYKLTATHPPSHLLTILTLLGSRCATCKNIGSHVQCCSATACLAAHKTNITRAKSQLDLAFPAWKASPAGVQAAAAASTNRNPNALWNAYYRQASQELKSQHDSHKRSSPSQQYPNFSTLLLDVYTNQDRIPSCDSASNI